MANNLIPEELNALIQQYLTDGVLTDKERQVILKKAEGLGLDRDEIDLYLDAEEQKIEQATEAAARKQKGKTCPYCGGSIPLLTDKCPHCGENITPEASEELQEILENLEKALVGLKSGKAIAENKAIVERYTRKAEMYYSNNPKIRKLLEQLQTEVVEAEKRGKVAARNAAISNAASSTAKGLGATIKYIALEHKKLTACIIAAIVVFVLFFAVKAKLNADPRTNPKACVEAIMDAISQGNITQAQTIYESYDGNSTMDIETGKDAIKAAFLAEIDELVCKGELFEAERKCHAFKDFGVNQTRKAFAVVSKAYYDDGNIEKALALDEESYVSFPSASGASSIRIAIQNDLINQGEYEKAEKLVDYTQDSEKYFEFLCECIDHMRENGQVDKVKRFVARKMVYFTNRTDTQEWYQKMQDYLGTY